MREQAGHGEIVGDEDDRQIHVQHEMAQEVEQTGLYGHVKAAGGLVHEHQTRRRDEVPGDLQALLHSPGIEGGLVVDAPGVDLHPLQPLQGPAAQRAVMSRTFGHQPFADVRPGADLHTQAVRGALVHESEFGAQEAALFAFRQRVDVPLTPGGVAVGDRSGGRFHASRKHVQERAFARPGFAHDAKHFAGPEVEGDVTAADMLPVTAGQVPGRQDGGGVPVFHCAPPCPSRTAARRAQQSVSEHTNMRFP